MIGAERDKDFATTVNIYGCGGEDLRSCAISRGSTFTVAGGMKGVVPRKTTAFVLIVEAGNWVAIAVEMAAIREAAAGVQAPGEAEVIFLFAAPAVADRHHCLVIRTCGRLFKKTHFAAALFLIEAKSGGGAVGQRSTALGAIVACFGPVDGADLDPIAAYGNFDFTADNQADVALTFAAGGAIGRRGGVKLDIGGQGQGRA